MDSKEPPTMSSYSTELGTTIQAHGAGGHSGGHILGPWKRVYNSGLCLLCTNTESPAPPAGSKVHLYSCTLVQTWYQMWVPNVAPLLAWLTRLHRSWGTGGFTHNAKVMVFLGVWFYALLQAVLDL